MGELAEVEDLSRNHRFWGMMCHLCTLPGIPLVHLIAPMLIWRWKKKRVPFVAEQGLESLNFQITMLICVTVAMLLRFVMIGMFLLWILIPFYLGMVIYASVKAYQGEHFEYLASFRLFEK